MKQVKIKQQWKMALEARSTVVSWAMSKIWNTIPKGNARFLENNIIREELRNHETS